MAAAVVGTQVHVVYIDAKGQVLHTMELADGSWTTPDLVAPAGTYSGDMFQSVTAASVDGALKVAVVDQKHKTVLHTVRSNPAFSYTETARNAEAVALLERIATDSTRVLGHEHPDTTSKEAALREWRRALKPWWRKLA